jgi:hypothetical protein
MLSLRSGKRQTGYFFEEGFPMTTSLEVARVFGKKHYRVMRDIRELEVPDHFRRSNFGFMEIIEEISLGGSVDESHYTITIDVHMIPMMGNTGNLTIFGADLKGPEPFASPWTSQGCVEIGLTGTGLRERLCGGPQVSAHLRWVQIRGTSEGQTRKRCRTEDRGCAYGH